MRQISQSGSTQTQSRSLSLDVFFIGGGGIALFDWVYFVMVAVFKIIQSLKPVDRP